MGAASRRRTVTVSETAGRAMNYTLAVVDEGLLGLTSFKTPNLHGEFYKREALGVVDLGPVRRSRRRLRRRARPPAGARRQRRAPSPTNPDEGKSRFPPVVKFLGPVRAQGRRETRAHRRAAAVRRRGARHGGGRRRQRLWLGGEVRVRAPGADDPADAAARDRPGRAVPLPVSVFTSEASIKDVKLEVQTDARFAAVGAPSTTLAFTRPEEKLGFLDAASRARSSARARSA